MLWRGAPVTALALMALSALMLPCAALAAFQRDWPAAQAFSQSAGLCLIAALGLAAALRTPVTSALARTEILTVIGLFAGAPVAAAAPVWMLAPALGPGGAYFEMVSTLTTTGATALSDPAAAPDALHLWRALTAWFGGFVTLMAAAAVFAPRNLGGYEVEIEDRLGPVGRLGGVPAWAGGQERRAAADARLDQAFRVIAPVYVALSVVLAGAFAASGQGALDAVVHAAGIVSTSGVTIDGRPLGGFGPEALAFVGMALAASRHTFGAGSTAQRLRRYAADPELELAAIAVGLAAGWVFLRHWFSTIEIDAAGEVGSALRALWGAVFTALSFLTTTGYVSEHWAGARAWSGLSSPGMLLLGLAAMGGGVASTAGGVKLLRSFALYQQGLRELDRLVEPRRSQSHGRGGRRVGFAGAALAWVFVMLFLLALGAATLAIAALGVPFERALAAAVASLSNAGPAYALALGPGAPGFSAMSDSARLVAAAAMVVGRVEVLAVVALANPAYWRR
jgi:trk system potassium uptake protein TrkH